MRTIGIKLADGSFYPILEEGFPSSKTLDITPANDNQTTVLVDLYRSEDGTMANAEYVDTLRIESLVPHPSGENTLSFNVSLDEEDRLTAKMHDAESGGDSGIEITLSPRTEAEREETKDDADSLRLEDEALAVAQAASGAAVESAAAADAAAAREALEQEPAEETEEGESDSPSATDEETIEISDDSGIQAEAGHTPVDFGDMLSATDAEESPAEEIDSGVIAADEDAEPRNDAAASDDGESSLDDLDLPDIDSENASAGEDTVTAETAADLPSGEESLPDLDLPDFGEEIASDALSALSSPHPRNDAAESDDGESSLDDLDLPDFKDMDFDVPEEVASPAPSQTALNAASLGLDDLDFGDTSGMDGISEEDTASEMEGLTLDDLLSEDATESSDADMNPAESQGRTSAHNAQTALYDDDERQRPAVWPVAVCVACAVICLAATAILVFVLPRTKTAYAQAESSESLAESAVQQLEGQKDIYTVDTVDIVERARREMERRREESKIASSDGLAGSETPSDAPADENASKVAPPAEENKIVVAEVPEKVVPVKVKTNKPDTKHKVQWGDTLWDISQQYYKTPWRYKYIAHHNRIKDPDYIQAGTTILIPAQ